MDFRLFVLGVFMDENGVNFNSAVRFDNMVGAYDPPLKMFMDKWLDGCEDRIFTDHEGHEQEFADDLMSMLGVTVSDIERLGYSLDATKG